MRQLNFDLVMNWLASPELALTPEQIDRLVTEAIQAEDRIKNRAARLGRVKAQADEVAKAGGYDSVEQLLQAMSPPAPVSPAGRVLPGRKRPFQIRKPYMSPFDPDAIYSLARHHPVPDAIAKLLANGWRKEELHFLRLGDSSAARGLKLTFDPLATHAALVAAELAKGKGT